MAVSKKTSSSKSSSKGLGKGLGRGINALIPEEPAETNEKVIVKEVVVKEPAETKVRLSQVEPNREQPRKMFDEDALIELSESIKQYGVLQPLLVQKKDNYYEIIAGERRWRAAKLAGYFQGELPLDSNTKFAEIDNMHLPFSQVQFDIGAHEENDYLIMTIYDERYPDHKRNLLLEVEKNPELSLIHI